MKRKYGWMSLVVAAMAAASVPVLAQEEGGPPPPPPMGGPGGPGRPGGPPPFRPGGPGRMGMPLAHLPLSALNADLKLSGEQKDKIRKIQEGMRAQRRPPMPPPDRRGDGPPDREAMRGRFDRMRALDREADQKINAVLTADQRKRVPGLMRDVRLFTEAGLPIELIGDLKLTSEQKRKLAGIVAEARQDLEQKLQEARQGGDPSAFRNVLENSRQETYSKALDIMTAAQRDKTEKFVEAHPRPEPGFGPGRGGFGPPPGGFGPPPGGFGPPPDGAGPPPDGFGPPPGGPEAPDMPPDGTF